MVRIVVSFFFLFVLERTFGLNSLSFAIIVVQRIRWSSCALSKLTLQAPIVADELGNLFNKEVNSISFFRLSTRNTIEMRNAILVPTSFVLFRHLFVV
jgi:hypothetical protein